MEPQGKPIFVGLGRMQGTEYTDDLEEGRAGEAGMLHCEAESPQCCGQSQGVWWKGPHKHYPQSDSPKLVLRLLLWA